MTSRNSGGMMGNLGSNAFMTRMMDRMFRRVENVVWDMMTGQVGVSMSNGSIITRGPVFYNGDDKTQGDFELNENLLEIMSMPIPAFAQNTPRDQVKVGDMIVMASNKIGWITAVKDRSFSIKTVDGSNTSWSPTKVNTIGATSDGIMVVRSLIDTAGGEVGMGNMMSMLMPLLMTCEDPTNDDGINKMIPMMLMMNNAGGGMASGNPMSMMAMAMMMGGKGGFFG